MNKPANIKHKQPEAGRRRRGAFALYCAGKVASYDWRHTLEGLDNGRLRALEAPALIAPDVLYVGPFFTTTDHGCTHNNGDHGVAAVNPAWPDSGEPMGSIIEPTPTHAAVAERSLRGIDAADVVVVYAQRDFDTAHGTHAELGAACAMGKMIIAFVDRDVTEQVRRATWFPLTLADRTVYGTPCLEVTRRIWRSRL